jgi:hypothetical protein
MSKETWSTAWSSPDLVWKWMLRSWTEAITDTPAVTPEVGDLITSDLARKRLCLSIVTADPTQYDPPRAIG